jgi:endonuclease YncB( thermonuclease family)
LILLGAAVAGVLVLGGAALLGWVALSWRGGPEPRLASAPVSLLPNEFHLTPARPLGNPAKPPIANAAPGPAAPGLATSNAASTSVTAAIPAAVIPAASSPALETAAVPLPAVPPPAAPAEAAPPNPSAATEPPSGERNAAAIPMTPPKAPLPGSPATPSSSPAPAAPSPSPARATASPLPVQEIHERPVHAVQEDARLPPAKPVTIIGRDGRQERLASAGGPPPGYVPSTSPSSPAFGVGRAAVERAAHGGTPGPVRAGLAGAVPPAPITVPGTAQQFDGQAQPAGGAALAIGGRTVQLFGVRLPQAAERCMSAGRQPLPCSEVARELLAARLRGGGRVSCRVPLNRPGMVSAICRDSTGADLGGYLVSEGVALADAGQSYDYVGAENAARSARRGLWAQR